MNLLLLPKLGYIGAAIVSVLTEALVWGIQLFYTRSYLKEVSIMKTMLKILVASGFMYIVLFLLEPIVTFTPMLNVVVYAVLGVVIYLVCIVLLKVVNLKDLKQQLVKK